MEKIPSFETNRGVQEQIMKKEIAVKNIIKEGLYIVSTPIGNLEDINSRALAILRQADLIICENPKHSLKLLNKQGIKKKLIPLHDYNEENLINKISKLKEGLKIALISDAGSPLISDPGYKLVKYFLENNVYVTAIPGCSSVINALQLSGLPVNNFAFYGFVPKQNSKAKNYFIKVKETGITGVCFVSANNIKKTIKNILEFVGDVEMSLCKEMTKIHETIYRENASKILKLIEENKILLKGEFTIVMSINNKNPNIVDPNIRKELLKLLKKYNLTEVVKIVHSLTGISKKDIYQMAIKLKDG